MLNLCETLEIHAKTRPNHPALISSGEQLNYREFSTRVHKYASALDSQGVEQGDLVGIALRDNIDHVVLMFAVMHLGAVIVPIDWRWTAREKEQLIEHFNVPLILVDTDDAAKQTSRSHAKPHSKSHAKPHANSDKQPARFTTCCIDESWRSRAMTLSTTPSMVKAPQLPMVLSLSSGTTGRPSGPLATHAHLFARLHNQLVTLTFNQHDRYLLATPLYFGGGRAFVLTHLVIGATVVLNPPPYSSSELINAVVTHKVSSLFLVPTILRRLLKESDATLSRLHSIRVLISSGAPLYAFERKVIQQRITTGFYEYYASTEGGGITILNPADQPVYPDSVGRAAFQVEIQIVDDKHKGVATDTVGQVRYRGPGVASSFYKDPEATSRSFKEGWFYPGDLGRINADGYLFLLGRSKDMIIRGGVNIYPIEIERVIGAFAGVAEVAVVPRPSAELGEEVAAFIVGKENLSESAILAYCRDQLAPYKIPARISFIDALPRNSAGKVLKTELTRRLVQIQNKQ